MTGWQHPVFYVWDKEVIRMIPDWVWWYVFIANVLQLLGLLLLIAGISLTVDQITVDQITKELIKFNKET